MRDRTVDVQPLEHVLPAHAADAPASAGPYLTRKA
jgi:hypothetical protein